MRTKMIWWALIGVFFPEGSSPGEDLEARWQSFCGSMTRKLKDDPQTFSAPICTFLKSYSKMNDTSIVSALCCFGEVPKVEAKPRQSSEMIVVQPALIARRKSELAERCASIAGPPPKHSRKQHEYSQEQCFSFPAWMCRGRQPTWWSSLMEPRWHSLPRRWGWIVDWKAVMLINIFYCKNFAAVVLCYCGYDEGVAHLAVAVVSKSVVVVVMMQCILWTKKNYSTFVAKEIQGYRYFYGTFQDMKCSSKC